MPEQVKPGPWYVKTSDLDPANRSCSRCERELSAAAVMLELDQRTDEFHDFGNVPADKSQGWFPFGLKCARKARARAVAARVPQIKTARRKRRPQKARWEQALRIASHD